MNTFRLFTAESYYGVILWQLKKKKVEKKDFEFFITVHFHVFSKIIIIFDILSQKVYERYLNNFKCYGS